MASQSFSTRIRFNWGFHDAASDVRHSRPNKWAGKTHFDESYRNGYIAGYATASRGESTDSSESTWYDAVAWGDVA